MIKSIPFGPFFLEQMPTAVPQTRGDPGPALIGRPFDVSVYGFGHFDGTIAYLRFWHGAALDADQVSELYAERTATLVPFMRGRVANHVFAVATLAAAPQPG